MRSNLTTIKLSISIILLISVTIFAQPELDVKPDRIEFEDLFNRFDQTYLINKGDQLLTIDSINYNHDNYIVEFEGGLTLPFTIVPDDSITMSVTLSSYYNITLSDTSDTMFIYNDGIVPIKDLKVRIRFFEDDYGLIQGYVRDTLLSPIANANIYFLFNGIYLLNNVTTDSVGFYIANLPEGQYTFAAEKEGYYVLFNDSSYDPYFADVANIDSGTVINKNFILPAIEDTSFYISGTLIDSLNSTFFNKGIVIIRHGTHVPINSPVATEDTLNVLAGFIKPDGSFKIYAQQPQYYFVQAYTNYFLPGYYNDNGYASVFWQEADTVLIDTTITDKNIYLVRDSSYGGGNAQGNITFNIGRGSEYYDGITLYAKSLTTNALYSYNFSKADGSFNVTNLPYGQYELMAQKIGIDDAYSQFITIDPLNPSVNGINIVFNITDVKVEQSQPQSFTLYPNYPNPFNPTTTISFNIPEATELKISVLNVLGEKIKTIGDDIFSAGLHKLLFDANGFSSGVYFILFESTSLIKSQKILLIK